MYKLKVQDTTYSQVEGNHDRERKGLNIGHVGLTSTIAVPSMKFPKDQRKRKRRKGKGGELEVICPVDLPVAPKHPFLRQLPLCPKPFIPSKLLYYHSFLE